MTGGIFFGFTILFLIGAVVVTLLYLINEIKKEDFYIAIGTVGGLFLISSIIACVYWAGNKLTNLELFYLIGFLLFLSVFTFTFLFRYSSTNKLEDETIFISVCAISGVLTLLFLILLTVSVSRRGGEKEYNYDEKGCIKIKIGEIIDIPKVYEKLLLNGSIELTKDQKKISFFSVIKYAIKCSSPKVTYDYLLNSFKSASSGFPEAGKEFYGKLEELNSDDDGFSDKFDKILEDNADLIDGSDYFRGVDYHLILLLSIEGGVAYTSYLKSLKSIPETDEYKEMIDGLIDGINQHLPEKFSKLSRDQIMKIVKKSDFEEPKSEQIEEYKSLINKT